MDGEQTAGDRRAAGEHEWDAAAYHRISDPQFQWGLRVLDRLALRGDEVVMDAGCGSGRLTAELCARLPRGRVIAVDRSSNMIEEARRHLAPRFGDRVVLRAADLQRLSAAEPVDVIFSTATFHWIPDHPLLFRHLFASLKPGGRLIAQCGGAGNLTRLRDRASTLMATPRFASFYNAWTHVWEYASADATRARLHEAGFVDIDADLEPAPTPFPDAASFRIFCERVVLRVHVSRLPDAASIQEFLAPIVAQAAADTPPFTLDYIRLNMQARRPA
jgi:trans-aconitate methyltransferase